MKQAYADAFAEIDQIFNLMPVALLDKIPNKFKQMVKDNKSDYTPNIKEPLEECKLGEETIIILSLIYRDFLCTNEEKEKLQYRDAQKIKEAEEELREKYNPDDIFKNRNRVVPQEEQEYEETSMTIMQEEKWYQKIFSIIKNLFNRKSNF